MDNIPVTDPHKAWNVKQFKRLEAYNARLQKLLDNAIKKAAAIAMLHDANASDEHLFSFSDDRQMKAEADKLMKDLSDEITSFTQSAEGEEWEKAMQQATDYIGQIYNLTKQTQERQDAFLDMMLGMRSRNQDALKEFNKRKIGGLNLSKKVWGYTQDFERQLEVSIDTALMQGTSAHELALSIQSLLKDPNDLFRRVRDDNDQLRLSKAMEAYHPGGGKYRSAYKNALRLARSEINMAYRSSDSNMAQMLDCVVGIQINLSNNHTNNGVPFTDICDQLAGKYPKGFKFVGWHPQCRCFITYILKTDDEFWNDLENEENNDSVNTVHDVPDNFKEWLKDNEQRIANANEKGTLPYFLKDNVEYLNFNIREINQRNELRKITVESGDFMISDNHIKIENLKTASLYQGKKPMKRLISHCRDEEEIEAAKYAWQHPNELSYANTTKLGEGKDLNDKKDLKNVLSKKKRGVINYNEYVITINGVEWKVLLEEHKKGFEQFYFIIKK